MYVTFKLFKETFAVNVSQVREIAKVPSAIRKMPNSPCFIKGICDFRQHSIIAMDLKKKLALADNDSVVAKDMMIISASGMILGLLVDQVDDVIEIDAQFIDNTADLAGKFAGGVGNGFIDEKFIIGIAHKNELTIILLNLEVILNSQEKSKLIGLDEDGG